MSNMNFLIADVIQFVSGTMITFSQRGVTKIKSKQFSEFDSRTIKAFSTCREKILISLENFEINPLFKIRGNVYILIF